MPDSEQQQNEVIVFDNLVSSTVSEKSSALEVANRGVEPFSENNGAGSFRQFESRDEIGKAASDAGMRIKKMFA